MGTADVTMCAFTATAGLLLQHGTVPCQISPHRVVLPEFYHGGLDLVQVAVAPWVILIPRERQVAFAERLSDLQRRTVAVHPRPRVAVDAHVNLSLKYLHDLLLLTGRTFPDLIVYM